MNSDNNPLEPVFRVSPPPPSSKTHTRPTRKPSVRQGDANTSSSISTSTGKYNIHLNEEDRQYFRDLFYWLKPDNNEKLSATKAVPFLRKSGLSTAVLGEIWQIADYENHGFLRLNGFFACLKLIGAIQNGLQLSSNILNSATTFLPKLDGLNVASPHSQPPPTSTHTPISLSQTQHIPTPTKTTSLISDEDKLKYLNIFDSLEAEDSFVSGDNVKKIFLESKLSVDKLALIWGLVDSHDRGKLNKYEFIIAMYYIDRCTKDPKESIPDRIPYDLLKCSSEFPSSSSSTPISPATKPTTRNSSITSLDHDDWSISPQQKAQIDKIFISLPKTLDGRVASKDAVPFLRNSGLSENILAHIWELSDTTKSGELSNDEFSIAMFLVQKKLNGVTLPSVLPEKLFSSSKSFNSASNEDNESIHSPQSYSRDNDISTPPISHTNVQGVRNENQSHNDNESKAQLESKLTQIQTTYESELKITQELEQTVGGLQQSIKEQKEEIQQLEAQTDDLLQHKSQVQHELNQKRAEFEQFQADIHSLNQLIVHAQNDLDNLEMQFRIEQGFANFNRDQLLKASNSFNQLRIDNGDEPLSFDFSADSSLFPTITTNEQSD